MMRFWSRQGVNDWRTARKLEQVGVGVQLECKEHSVYSQQDESKTA